VFGVVDFEDILYVLDCWLHTSLYLFVLIMCKKNLAHLIRDVIAIIEQKFVVCEYVTVQPKDV